MSMSRILSGVRGTWIRRAAAQQIRCLAAQASGAPPPADSPLHTPEHVVEPPLPPFQEKLGESTDKKKARLVYQSRKRGMLENGILLRGGGSRTFGSYRFEIWQGPRRACFYCTFVDRYLDDMNDKQLRMYDFIINKPGSDWDIYYWMIGSKPAPEEFDNEVMDMLKRHAINESHELRTGWPDLK